MNYDKLILDCYRELYRESTPPADFDQLVADALINEFGQKEIPFMDYTIPTQKMEEIITKYANQIKATWMRVGFRNTILLGCSPKNV